MGKTLHDISSQLKNNSKKVQLIYAFNGVGKTRLSRAFKDLISPKDEMDGEDAGLPKSHKILYYNAFTEDLFYWDNDLIHDSEPKLRIQPNLFTEWILKEQGQDQNIISYFQYYTNDKLTPHFSTDFSEVTFTIETGDDPTSGLIKISKGEESNFIWSIFYTLLDLVIEVLNVVEPEERETERFNQLEYIFIDDPVSSLDDNHLIEIAVNLAQRIKSNESDVKFILTTHNPLFYNVLFNELNSDDKHYNYKRKWFEKYRLNRFEDGFYELIPQPDDSPFSYHLHLKSEIYKAIELGQVSKYHFNFLRKILEKTSTFLGYNRWGDLLPKSEDGRPNPYATRIVNISSHSKHSGEEVTELTEDDKRMLKYLIEQLDKTYRFKANLSA